MKKLVEFLASVSFGVGAMTLAFVTAIQLGIAGFDIAFTWLFFGSMGLYYAYETIKSNETELN